MMIDTELNCDRDDSGRPYPYFAPQSAADDQITWLTNELDESDSFDWNFVVGHYQIQDPAGGNDSKFNGCMDPIDSLLQNYPVTAYIAGHEHQASSNVIFHVQITCECPWIFSDFLYLHSCRTKPQMLTCISQKSEKYRNVICLSLMNTT